MLTSVVRFVVECCRTILGFVSVVVVTVCALGILAVIGLEITGAELSPYIGILTYMVLPAGFVLGLLGIALARWRARRAISRGEPLRGVLDLSDPRHRERLMAVGVLTAVNLLIVGLAGYHGVHYMDSTAFCGKTCHQVMEPEFTAYQGSAHARVACTDCHIGPGASWFVRSKLSGTRQVFAAAFHTYERPIPTPIQNLRPARETCEQCHWPTKFHGDKMKVYSRYEQDSTSTELKTALLLKVGGGSLESGFSKGIHWHVASKIDYRATPDRSKIHWVRVEDATGTREYWSEEARTRPDSILALPVRRMDCLDCHNRPTHTFELPSDALDAALHQGQMAADLPYIKREAMALLTAEWPTKQAAVTSFGDSLQAFYARSNADVATTRRADIDAAGAALAAIYARNIFPAMKIGWGTYPNMIGHRNDGGCFRCHDDLHATSEGRAISQDCTTCHHLLAMEEADPPVLRSLYGEQ